MRRSLALLTCTFATIAGLTACGGGSTAKVSANSTTPPASPTPSATAPADPAAAKAQIKANWEKFFAYRTKTAVAKSLLEDGSSMSGAIAFARLEQRQTHLKQAARVKLIVFTSATSANVTWALLNGTQVLLPSASGSAVYIDGTWKVSKQSFCTLVTLGANGKPVPGCPST